jgi:hypothetical protein
MASCIAGEVQILSFQIDQVGPDNATPVSGFTISFKQQGHPEVLRLIGEAIDISHPEDLRDQWIHPSRQQRFVLAPTPGKESRPFDDEFAELEGLEAQSHHLQTLIGEQKHVIHQLLRDDFHTFCSTIKECDSLKCIFQTIVHKLPHYAHIVSLHFRHHRLWHHKTAASEIDSSVDGIRKQGDNAVLYGGAKEYLGPPRDEHDASPEVSHDELDASPPDNVETSPTPLSYSGYTSPSPISSQTRHLSATPTPHYTGNDRQPLSSQSHYNTTAPFPQFDHPPPGPFYLFIHLLPALLLIGISVVILLALRHFKLLCASPRSRASRSASREERRSRRAYRRAELQHVWKNWWNRYRSPASTNDYEEKRTLILEQEDVLEDVMQDEIRGLRVAQEIVGEMVRAEEGRARLYQEANMPQHQRPYTAAEFESSSSHPPFSPTAPTLSRIDSLPRYARRSSNVSSNSAGSSVPPPQYEQELEGDIDVVDGFTYSRTFGAGNSHTLEYGYDGTDDSSPDSSVVDCSPRMSFDTGRTSLITTTIVKDRAGGC